MLEEPELDEMELLETVALEALLEDELTWEEEDPTCELDPVTTDASGASLATHRQSSVRVSVALQRVLQVFAAGTAVLHAVIAATKQKIERMRMHPPFVCQTES